MKKTNVLVFPCGAENALCIIEALRYNLHFEVFGATNRKDHSEYVLDRNHLSIDDYDIHSDTFLDLINRFIDSNNIEYIIPTHDEIIMYLVENQEKLHATVVASPAETCKIAFSKIDTFKRLKGASYLPKEYSRIDKRINFPVFIKPNHGAGGKGAKKVENLEELNNIGDLSSYLVTEYLPGDEYTIDCFTNNKGKLLFIGPRSRERITTGMSFRSSRVELSDEIRMIAEDLNKRFTFRGLWFFQLKKDSDGRLKLMEISVRFAGTMDLYRELGVNFPCLSLFDFMGYDVEIICNSFDIELDRRYKSSYKVNINYNYVYIDFDDTLIIDGKINSIAMRFIYQCVNRGVKIVLLTKHDTDIYDDLKRYKISDTIFDEIIHISKDDKKINHITSENAIFIDNYFPDRKEVFNKKNIPVFDVDAIEALLSESEV